MQPDLERVLREARAALPDPDPESMRRGIAHLRARSERAARRRRVPLTGGVALATVFVFALAALGAERIVESQRVQATTRVVDRTLVCTTGVIRGLRAIEVQAGPRVVQVARPGMPRGHASVASVTSGPGSGTTSVGVSGRLADGIGWHAVGLAWYTPAECRQVSTRFPGTNRVRVPLTAAGLGGGHLDVPERHFCELAAPVVVRVRAVFARPTSWRRWTSPNPRHLPGQMRAYGAIREGYLAVRSQVGNRPLAFAAVTQTRARLFVAPRCWRMPS
jgi:hypothetical protein